MGEDHIEPDHAKLRASEAVAAAPDVEAAPPERMRVTERRTVSFACHQCGATAEVPKLSKGPLRYCPNCGAANINPADQSASSIALADAASPAEALEIYNHVLRDEPESYLAWFGRGRVLGELSTLDNPTCRECIKAMDNAVRFAPFDKKIDLSPRISEQLDTAAVSFYAQANTLLGAYMGGEHDAATVSQIWQVYVEATKMAVEMLKAAAEHDPFN